MAGMPRTRRSFSRRWHTGFGLGPIGCLSKGSSRSRLRTFVSPRPSYGFTPHGLYGTCKPIDQIVSQYYLRVSVVDKPGVLAQVAGILGSENIGISSVIQPEAHEGDAVPLILMLHDATHRQMH